MTSTLNSLNPFGKLLNCIEAAIKKLSIELVCMVLSLVD